MSRAEARDEGRLLQLVYYGYVFSSAAARVLPEFLVYGCARLLGGLAARISKKRDVVERNLTRITGLAPGSAELDALVRETFRSYATYWLETFRLVRADKDFFISRMRATGTEKVEKILAAGSGAVIVVGHLGNWDAAGAWAGAIGWRIATVAEPLRPRRMFEFFAAHRAKLGMTIYPAQPGATDVLADEVRNGAVVAILGDRDLKGRGPEVRFFDDPANLPAGPAIVALKARVPLLVAGVYSERLPDGRHGWSVDFGDPIELPEERSDDNIREITQRVAQELERFIRRRPEEWHVLQPFWRADRGQT